MRWICRGVGSLCYLVLAAESTNCVAPIESTLRRRSFGSCGVSTLSNACSGHCDRPGPGVRHTAVCTPVIGSRRRVGVSASCRMSTLSWQVPPLSGSVEVPRLLSLPTSYTPPWSVIGRMCNIDTRCDIRSTPDETSNLDRRSMH